MVNVPYTTVEEIRQYATDTDNESAYNLLLLYGPDSFDGTYEEYTKLLDELSSTEFIK